MSVDVKICGLRDAEALAAAASGARYAGFVFYPKSPRAIDAEMVSRLIKSLPENVISVGLFVDVSDEEIARVLRIAPLQMLQLHGAETPERVVAVKKRAGLPVIKAIGIASVQDVEEARRYEAVADMLLLDAKPQAGQLPGGNASAFDWNILKNVSFKKPWLLAGGLNEANLAEAIQVTGAGAVDISSGVEDAPGRKNVAKIKAFLAKAAQLETSC